MTSDFEFWSSIIQRKLDAGLPASGLEEGIPAFESVSERGAWWILVRGALARNETFLQFIDEKERNPLLARTLLDKAVEEAMRSALKD
jgi:hypothetical protein